LDGEVLTGVVIRFGVRSESDMFYADRRKPLLGDFDLGSSEELEAREKRFATLSAWDEALTTVEQAQAFLSPNRRLPIWLAVEEIRALKYGLRVLRAPHPKDLPGREGHCEIGNVWPGDKATFRAIRSDLCEIARSQRSEL
jgi:hypothetical protein